MTEMNDSIASAIITTVSEVIPEAEVIVVIDSGIVHVLGRYQTELGNATVAFDLLAEYIKQSVSEQN